MSALTRSVVIHDDSRGPWTVPEERIHFTFASGRLAYDCIGCNAECCRGHRFQLFRASDLKRHLQTNPRLAWFMTPVGSDPWPSDAVAVQNYRPGCYFLTDEGRCTIHATQGFEAKPETCRLFPFNELRRVGDDLIVAPHEGLCPLQVMPHGLTSDLSCHGRLLDSMAAAGIHARVPHSVPVAADACALMSLEDQVGRIAETSPDVQDYGDFVQQQIMATEEAGFDEGNVAGSGVRRSLQPRAWLEEACRVMAAKPQPEHLLQRSLIHTMVAVTPVLRNRLLFRRSMADRWLAGITVERAPYAMYALHVVAALALEAGMRTATYQTLIRLGREHESVLVLLAHVEDAMEWRPGSQVDMPVNGSLDTMKRYARIARSLLPDRHCLRQTTLGTILSDNAPTDPSERAFFLKGVSQWLMPRIHRIGTVRGSGVKRTTAKGALEKWALRRAPEDVYVGALRTQARWAARRNEPYALPSRGTHQR